MRYVVVNVLDEVVYKSDDRYKAKQYVEKRVRNCPEDEYYVFEWVTGYKGETEVRIREMFSPPETLLQEEYPDPEQPKES